MNKKQIVLTLLLLLLYVVVFIIQKLTTGQYYWSVVGITVLSPILIYLSTRRGIQRLIGEYPQPERSNEARLISWFSGTILMLVLTLFILLEQLSKSEVDYKNFIIFIIAPILVACAVGIMKIPNVTKKTITRLKSVIKKSACSIILFVLFIPFFTLTNKLHIDINSQPNINPRYWFNGFVGWAMIFCFYLGLFLFIFALSDFILAIKDLSTRTPRKSRKTRKTK